MLSERLFKDGVLTIDEAHKMLSPYYNDIMLCIHEGLRRTQGLKQRESEYCAPLTSRSLANMVHDQIEFVAKRVFARKDKEIAVFTENGFLVVDFYGRIFLRFKKLKRNLMPCNIETEQQRAFDEQMLFDGPATHLSAGYRLNDLGEYKDAHIVCVSHHTVQWSLPLPEIKKVTRKEIVVPVPSDKPTVVVRKTAMRKLGNAS